MFVNQKNLERELFKQYGIRQDIGTKIYKAKAITGEWVYTIFQEFQLSEMIVRNEREFKQIKPYDFPKEFEQGNFHQLQPMLKTGKYKISRLDNGDCKVYFHLGLKGGMIKNDPKKMEDLKFRVAEETSAQLVSSLGRNLTNVKLEKFSFFTGTSIKTGAIGGGLAIGTFIGKECGFSGIATVALAIIAGIIGYIGSKKFLGKFQEKANAIKTELEKMEVYFYALQNEVNINNKVKIEEIAINFKSYLEDNEYIKKNDTKYNFILNEEKFLQFSKYLDEDKVTNFVSSIKIFILTSLSHLPKKIRPSETIIDLLEDLIKTDNLDSSLKDFGHIILSQVLEDKGDDEKRIMLLKEIKEESDLYSQAQAGINMINEINQYRISFASKMKMDNINYNQ
jgi:hypothetical protein